MTDCSSVRERPRNGPPLAVTTSLLTSDGRPERRHWYSAECSGVDGHDLAAALVAHLRDDRAARDQALLVGQREPLAVPQRAERRREAGEADDRVEHDVGLGMRGELLERRGVVAAEAGRIGTEAELRGLRRERLGVAARGQRDEPVIVRMAAQHVERLATDRSRRPQNHHAARHTVAQPRAEVSAIGTRPDPCLRRRSAPRTTRSHAAKA